MLCYCSFYSCLCVFVLCYSFFFLLFIFFFFFFKQKTAYEMRISDWSSDVCSSDLARGPRFVENKSFSRDAPKIHPRLEIQLRIHRLVHAPKNEIGRASCRERVCQYV